jgi:hypothetical protein
MILYHFSRLRSADHDGDVGTGLQSQSPSHLIANTGHIRVRVRRAEYDLFHRLHSARKEHPPHQAANLFACEIRRIPSIRLT